MERAPSVHQVNVPSLAGLPRRRPKSLPPKRAIQAIFDLRQLKPPVYLTPEGERAFIEGSVLTQEKCLRWLDILKQLFAEQPLRSSKTVALRSLPPISFLNLLTDWIDVYAKVEGRRKTRGPRWRWNALRGFVHRERRLQSRKLLRNISLLAKSIAAHFDDPLFLLWGDYRQHSGSKASSLNELSTAERGREAARVFDVLKRVRNNDKVLADDYDTLKQYVSKEFKEPIIKMYLPDPSERKSMNEFVARAAAMDVYLQYLRMVDTFALDLDYAKDATRWLLKLGEPDARPLMETIRSRFCGPSDLRS